MELLIGWRRFFDVVRKVRGQDQIEAERATQQQKQQYKQPPPTGLNQHDRQWLPGLSEIDLVHDNPGNTR